MSVQSVVRIALCSFAFFGLADAAFAQKSVNEKCEADADCKSGNCVTVKGGERKCCDCKQKVLDDDFTAVVDAKCKDLDSGILGYKDVEREFGSKNEVSQIVLFTRAEYVAACFDARSAREKTCWAGGDPGHQEQLKELDKARNYLQRLLSEKRSQNLAYNCEPDRYEDTQKDIDNNCRDVDALFAKYGANDGQEVACGDMDNLLDKVIDCREALDSMINDCFRSGAPAARNKRLEDVRLMERTAKDTREAKKTARLCK